MIYLAWIKRARNPRKSPSLYTAQKYREYELMIILLLSNSTILSDFIHGVVSVKFKYHICRGTKSVKFSIFVHTAKYYVEK